MSMDQELIKPEKTSSPRRFSFLARFLLGAIIFVGFAWLMSAIRTKDESPKIDSSEEKISQVEELRYGNPEVVVDGENKYKFGTVTWTFEPQPVGENGVGSTRVRLKIVDFKRNNTVIDVAGYRLGTYKGTCDFVDEEVYAVSIPDRNALSFAQCWFAGSGRQLGVFQEGPMMVVKSRMIAEEDDGFEEMVPILTIDMRKIVQP